MKKFIFAVIACALFSSIPLISFASIDTNLMYGSQGTAVWELQDFLFSKGFLTVQPNGYFFSTTRNAVIKYQKSVGLPHSGYVGISTRAQINNELAALNAPAIAAANAESGAAQPVAIQQPVQQTASVIQSTTQSSPSSFTLPSGVVIDPNGNVVSTSTTAQPTDDQTAGKNYYIAHNTCAPLNGVNTVQYNACVNYAFSLTSSTTATTTTTTTTASSGPAPTCTLQTASSGIIWYTTNTTTLNLYGGQNPTLIQALTPVAGGQLNGINQSSYPIKITATGPGGTATCGVMFVGQTSNGM